MEEITKKHKIKVICILLAIIMVISTVGLIFIFRDKDDPNNPDGGGSGKSLILDYVKGEKEVSVLIVHNTYLILKLLLK